MRTADRARAHNDFARRGGDVGAIAATEFDAGAAFALEGEATDQRIGLDTQVCTVSGRSQERPRRRGAKANAATVLRISDAFLHGAVVIRRTWDAGLFRGVHESVGRREYGAIFLDCHGAAATAQAIVATAAGIRLGLLEQRQHVLVAPAAAAHLRPAVVVARVAAHVEHAVDRRAPAEHLAARPMQGAPRRAGLRLGKEVPVEARMAHQLDHAGRNVNERAGIARTRLDQQHACRAILAQPARQHAASGARADDDVIRCDCFGGFADM